MRFWAKAGFKGAKDAQNLIRAFFAEFNPESSITIKGNVGKVEIFFNECPPQKIIDALSDCETEEFYFGKVLKDYIGEDNQQTSQEESEENQQQTAQEESEESQQQTSQEESEESQQQASKEESEESQQQTSQAESGDKQKEAINAELDGILSLEKMAKQASDFNHFVKLVGEWLEMQKQQENFEKLVKVVANLGVISWRNIADTSKDKELSYNGGIRVKLGKMLHKKWIGITPFDFLRRVAKYQHYPFGRQQSESVKVRMQCMPEIPSFEEVLGKVDKTQPIEERLKYVLTAMGWNEQQENIYTVAKVAMGIKQPSFDAIVVKANIPKEAMGETRMAFATFVNQFARQYDSTIRVKVMDFFKQLQEVLLTESELQELSD